MREKSTTATSERLVKSIRRATIVLGSDPTPFSANYRAVTRDLERGPRRRPWSAEPQPPLFLDQCVDRLRSVCHNELKILATTRRPRRRAHAAPNGDQRGDERVLDGSGAGSMTWPHSDLATCTQLESSLSHPDFWRAVRRKTFGFEFTSHCSPPDVCAMAFP